MGASGKPGAVHWEKRARKGLDVAEILERSDVVTVGIDGGGLDDLLGLAILGRDRETRGWLLWVHAWAHVGVLELRKSEAARLQDFKQDGDLTIVDDMGTAYTEVAKLVDRVNRAGLLDRVGLDPAGVGLIVDELAQKGISTRPTRCSRSARATSSPVRSRRSR